MAFRALWIVALLCSFGCDGDDDGGGSSGSGGSGGSQAGGTAGTSTGGAGAGGGSSGGTGGSAGASAGGTAGAGTGGSGGSAASGTGGGTGGGAGTSTAGAGGGAGAGVGCSGACLFETSFTTAEGWTGNVVQFGTGCGTGFSGIQTGVGNNGAWTTSSGSCDTVTTEANYASGAGGRGFRHFRGDGTNSNGGGLTIDLPSPVTEIWYSFRFRFSSGFQWAGGQPNYTKDLYWHSGGGFLIAGHQGGGWGFHVGGHDNYPGSTNWSTLYAGGAADGSWHCLDYHHDIAQSSARVWLDGAPILDSASIDYSGFPNFTYFQLGENQAVVSGGDYYTDYDDVRIDTGLPAGSRLGCLGSGG